MSGFERLLACVGIVAALGGCSTNIHEKPDTIVPTTQRLGTFPLVAMRPLTVEKMEGDPGDRAAVDHIRRTLRHCMSMVFPEMRTDTEPVAPGMGALMIEPTIVELKKVTGAERFWIGAMAGSSAALLRMRYIDVDRGTELAAPVFYAKANAWGGGFTFGGTDNAMLSRLTDQACDYSRNNK